MKTLIARLRRQGVAIGSGCVIFTDQFSLEPCLVEIGDRVATAVLEGRVGDGDTVTVDLVDDQLTVVVPVRTA